MKNKNTKILIIIVTILLFIFLVLILRDKISFNIDFNDYHKKEIMSEDEKNLLGLYHLGVYEVVSRDETGKLTAYKLTKLEDEKPIDIEFMTDTEKVKKDFYMHNKIQVLQRDKNGEVIAYKIIKNDSDVISKY